jgi:tight adherence protein C
MGRIAASSQIHQRRRSQCNAPIIFYAAKTCCRLLFAVLTYVGLELAGKSLDRNSLILVLLVMATFGCYLPNWALRRAIKARKREIFENFPDAADLMLICVEAGLGLDAALFRVADEMRSRAGC